MTYPDYLSEELGLTRSEIFSQVWWWLKAEQKYLRAEYSRLRAQGVSEHVLRLRRRGIADSPPVLNRAYRRRMGLKRIGRMA
jgi:hypothetical protein